MTLLLRHHRGLDVLIERSHAIGVRLADPDLAALIGDLRRLPSAVPKVVTVREQQLIRGVLGYMFSRIVCAAHLEKQTDLARAFLAWSALPLTSGTWRTEWARLVNYCAAALREIGYASKERRAPHGWVSRVLGLIHARYRDPELSLSIVAKAADRSPWHVARTLKSQTGQGFVAHLRDARVSAARWRRAACSSWRAMRRRST
jgi:hypothetical protein